MYKTAAATQGTAESSKYATQQAMLIIFLKSLSVMLLFSSLKSLFTFMSHRCLKWPCVRRRSLSPLSSFVILTVLAVFLKASKFLCKNFQTWFPVQFVATRPDNMAFCSQPC